MRPWRRALLGAITLVPLGCSGQGSTDTVYTGNQISDYAAIWDGYAEAYTFDDGSDRIRLTMSLDGHGTLQVGEMPLLAPPTDPNIGYPPAPYWNWNSNKGRVGEELKPGFQYPIYQTRVDIARLRFGADYHDIYQEWCAMQTPHLVNTSSTPPIYACVSDQSYGTWPSDDGTSCSVVDGFNQPVSSGIDCAQVLLCLIPNPTWLCPCDATSCSIPNANGVYPIQIDGALEMEGDNLVGTLANGDTGSRFTVRLTRQ